MKFRFLAAAAVSLALAACGSADDASTEAEADTVEMPADAALEGVSETPVADPNANAAATDAADATEEVVTEEQQIEEAGDNAAATAEAALDAMEEEQN